MKKYKVSIKRKLIRQLYKFPIKIQTRFYQLVKDLASFGPILIKWPSYRKLSRTTYHCHLDYSWVACWHYEKSQIQIEVIYVGSRENAPY